MIFLYSVRTCYVFLTVCFVVLLFVSFFDYKSIAGEPPGRAHLGHFITVHHLHAFLKSREG